MLGRGRDGGGRPTQSHAYHGDTRGCQLKSQFPSLATIQQELGKARSKSTHAVFPQTEIQRCIIHQIRHSLQYVAWKDRKAFVADLKAIYQAGTACGGVVVAFVKSEGEPFRELTRVQPLTIAAIKVIRLHTHSI
jgi:hypothetical protein